MSVLIKGMEMPKNCAYCTMLEGDRDDGLCHAASRWLDDEEYWLWYQYPEGDIDTSKPINCPLVPVPAPHGDLIDRWDLTETAMIDPDEGKYVAVYCADEVDKAPVVIEAEE